jgi:hypothetical protein
MMSEETDLDLIPRSIRDKLDRVGIKLHLKEWQRLSLDERRRLRDDPCESVGDVERYRQLLVEMVARRTGRAPEKMGAGG